MALSVIITWGYFYSGESLLLPILLHGSFDAAWETMTIVLPGFQPGFDWALAVFWCVLAVIVWSTGLPGKAASRAVK